MEKAGSCARQVHSHLGSCVYFGPHQQTAGPLRTPMAELQGDRGWAAGPQEIGQGGSLGK